MDAHVTDRPDTPAASRGPDEDPPGRNPAPQGPAPTGTAAAGTTPPTAPAGPGSFESPKRHWMRWTALGLSVVILALAGLGWLVYSKLSGNIRTDSATQNELERYEAERPPAESKDAQNILLIGSDDRGGGNGEYGADTGTQRSDTTILLHLAADRTSATAVSIPRDLMAEIPRCRRSDGERTEPRSAVFNSAFETAGAACTIRTVENMTGIRVDHHMIVDFTGFKKMVDAVDGVEVCLPRAVHDRAAHLSLPAGRQVLRGEEALGYVRVRKSLGNGSDTQRMERQQRFLAALVKKVYSNGVLLNPGRLYPVLDAATSSLTTDKDLASLKGLYDLVRSMRDIPAEQVRFLTVPRQAYAYDVNRDELVQPDADRLFTRLRKDRPVSVRPAPTDRPRDPDDTAAYDDPSADLAQRDGKENGKENNGERGEEDGRRDSRQNGDGGARDDSSEANGPNVSGPETGGSETGGSEANRPETDGSNGSNRSDGADGAHRAAPDSPDTAPTFRGTAADRRVCG